MRGLDSELCIIVVYLIVIEIFIHL